MEEGVTAVEAFLKSIPGMNQRIAVNRTRRSFLTKPCSSNEEASLKLPLTIQLTDCGMHAGTLPAAWFAVI
jgi:hypothetical protein